MHSSTDLVIVIVVIAAAIILAAIWFTAKRRTRKLRGRFGQEYDRAVGQIGDRRRAESELARRQERVEYLDIRSLPNDLRENFATEWLSTQAQFVDDPEAAVVQADMLVSQVMQARGYPTKDFEQRASDISVDHPGVIEHYRAAHAIALRQERGGASTEDLRMAMVHYRVLFEDLLEAPASGRDRAA